MIFYVFDIESDGLLDEATKIHCLSYQKFEFNNFLEKGTLTDYQDIRDFFDGEKIVVGHNIIGYDFPLINKILGKKIENRCVDTLGLSYFLYPDRKRHGLESWGQTVGVKKPEVEDWEDQPLEVYINRCEEDVEINAKIFIRFFRMLASIYNNDISSMMQFSNYLNFKLECSHAQEVQGIPLNSELNDKYLEETFEALEAKKVILQEAMPKDIGVLFKTKPKKMFRKDGSISKKGKEWIEYLKENNLPLTTTEVRKAPNAGSIPQLKEWLFRLGWEPETFKESESTGLPVPQISLPFGQGICPSVKKLYSIEPRLEELEQFFMIRHRHGIFKGYKEKIRKDGKVGASIGGFTKTLRMAHRKPLANLPKPSVYFGKQIREVLSVPDDSYIMIGSDISGLEDNTKQHFIYPYDPQYVEEMRVPGFDPHLDIGLLTGAITKEDIEFYNYANNNDSLDEEEKARLSSLKTIRGTSKNANFAATYGAMPPKVAEVAKIPLEQAELLWETYWKRNWAIKKVAESCNVKYVGGKTWIQSPLSGFWLLLTSDKDRFSAINQNAGVYVFDLWVRNIRKEINKLGIELCLQYHDEVLLYFKKEYVEEVTKILYESMEKVNQLLKLNVEISISVDIGKNYAECH